MYSEKLIFVFSLISLSFSIYPIAVFHGIIDGCDMKNTSMLVNDLKRDLGVHVECLEIGNGFWDSMMKPIDQQVEIACESIKSNPHFQDKFSILGISQGTLIGRYIIEKCDIKGQVMRYMSFDGPQMGVGFIPKINCGTFCDWIVNLTVPMAYKFKDTIAPMEYLKYKYDRSYYDEHDVFLKMLNNDYEKYEDRDQEIYRRFTSLEKVKLIKSREDSVIVPRESCWFEFYDRDGKTIIPLEESDFYIQDYIGLRKLIEEGKVTFTEFAEEHVLYHIKEYQEEIVPFFLD
jgi:palmitoyl-protein thioesterase